MLNGDETNETHKREAVVGSFIDAIAPADGRLLALPGGTSRLDEPLFISARMGEDEVTPGTSYLNVDVVAKRGNEYVPVGIYDWEIVGGGRAVGNKQRHGHLPTRNPAQETAERYWSTGEALHVRDDNFLKYATENGGFTKMSELRNMGVIQGEEQWTQPIYQGLGIGGLMIAVSAITLDRHGVTEMDLGTLSKPAKQAWKKFGRGDRQRLSPKEVTGHQSTERALAKFLL